MRRLSNFSRAAATAWLAVAILLAPAAAFAQQALGPPPPGEPNQGRDCQTVRTCNFSRTASVRGCLSSYTCRACRLVTARCTVGPNVGRNVCQEMRCGWGG